MAEDSLSNDDRAVKISPKASDPDLRYKFWQLMALYLNLLVAVIGFFALVITVNSNTSSLRANVQNNVLSHVSGLDKLFLEKPYLRAYFYDGKEPDPQDPGYQEVIAAAEWFTDVLDIAGVQNERFRDEWEDPEAWDNWTIDMLKHSPVMRKFLEEHSRWYSQGLTRKLKRAQAELKSDAMK